MNGQRLQLISVSKGILISKSFKSSAGKSKIQGRRSWIGSVGNYQPSFWQINSKKRYLSCHFRVPIYCLHNQTSNTSNAPVKWRHNSLKFLDLWFIFPQPCIIMGTPRLSIAKSLWNCIWFQCSWNFKMHVPKFNQMKWTKWIKILLDWRRKEIQILVHKSFGLILFNTPPAFVRPATKCTLVFIYYLAFVLKMVHQGMILNPFLYLVCALHSREIQGNTISFKK